MKMKAWPLRVSALSSYLYNTDRKQSVPMITISGERKRNLQRRVKDKRRSDDAEEIDQFLWRQVAAVYISSVA
jgi:hypothetical protein